MTFQWHASLDTFWKMIVFVWRGGWKWALHYQKICICPTLLIKSVTLDGNTAPKMKGLYWTISSFL